MKSQLRGESQHNSMFIPRGSLGSSINKISPIDSLFTLRKLQNILLIPRNMTPIQLKTDKIMVSNPEAKKKYLLISARNSIYYGLLSNEGIPEDPRAVCIFPQGSYYEGSFKNGKMDGNGRISNLQCSYIYEGEWKNGLPHGNGTEKIQNNYYEGRFYQGQKHGFGIQTYEDGSRFEGNFWLNKIEGQGKYQSKTNVWEGQWKDGYLQGFGIQILYAKNNKNNIYQPSSSYRGDFIKGEKHGKGVYIWPQKYEYEGEFKNGQLDGEGLFKFKNRIYQGVWSKGTQVKISEVYKSQNSTQHRKLSSIVNQRKKK